MFIVGHPCDSPRGSGHRFACLAVFGCILAVLAASYAAAGHDTRLPLPDRPHYAIEHFGERYGLSAITVISLAQDHQGFLWIGSQTGIYRYDGLSITPFGLAEGLPGVRTTQLLVAPDGKLWARMRKGLARLEGQRFVSVSIPPQAGNFTSDTASFAVDAAGRLFVAVERGLLLRDAKEGTTRVLGPADGLPSGQVEAIVRGPDDIIWFAAGRRLARILPGSLRPEVLAAPELPAGRVVALVVDGHGQLWVRTENHLATVDTKRPFPQDLIFHDTGVPGANMEGAPVLDRLGNLMLPTATGLYRWLGDRWQVVDRKNGLTSSAVFSALEDREGTIWVGLAGAGLDRWPGSNQWSGWIDDDGLPDPLILSVVRDHRARLWVGTNTALSMWDGERHRWQVWNKTNGLVGSGTRSLLLTRDGALWALAPGAGLTWLDASSARPVPVPVVSGKEAASIVSITMAPDDAVWWNGEKVLHVVHRRNGRFGVDEIPVPEPVQGTTRFISLSPGGILWTGGPNGLSRFDGTRWQQFGVSDGLLDKDIRSVMAVSDDEVWFGYGDENTATRARLTSAGKLQLQHVAKGACLLGMDRTRNAWLEMDNSAAKLSPDGRLRNFTQSDGLLWNDTNCGAFWQDADETILIGTSHGLARYDPTQEDLPRTPPAVVLMRAEFAGTERLAQERPRVPYQQGSFAAQFAALTFRDPDQVHCRYRLSGLESAFTETSLREARYSALPPGDYAFEVSCGSPDLGWSTNPAIYSFTVLTPWWRSPWVGIAAFLTLALFVVGFTRLRTRRLESERKRLEAAVAERSAELARANRELQEASLTDPLTGVRNRRFFYSTVAADANQATRAYYAEEEGYSRDHRDLIFYLIDLDHFKDINDAFGHDAGDEVLVEVSRRLARVVRQSDFLIRWGGEEFLVVCRAADRKTATVVAEKILTAIGQEPISISGGQRVNRTCSVGWAPYPFEPGVASLTVDDVLKLADRGLYRAKERGRNHAVGMLPLQFAGVTVGAGSSDNSPDPSGPLREVVSPGPGGSQQLGS
jgi:diguanylate cyclase (GGDEF)-like protein